jgi:hypothetical protein
VKRDLVAIHAQIIGAHEAAQEDRAGEVTRAREKVRLLLGQHGLFFASFAVSRDPAGRFLEFRAIASRMRAGGFHHLRLLSSGREP